MYPYSPCPSDLSAHPLATNYYLQVVISAEQLWLFLHQIIGLVWSQLARLKIGIFQVLHEYHHIGNLGAIVRFVLLDLD